MYLWNDAITWMDKSQMLLGLCVGVKIAIATMYVTIVTVTITTLPQQQLCNNVVVVVSNIAKLWLKINL